MLTVSQKNTRPLCEYLALITLTVCAFAIPISVTLTTITYLLAFLLILFSLDWKMRWQRIKKNPATLSFWILFALFVIGLTYTVSPIHAAWHDLQKRHWMFITPFLLMLPLTDQWRNRFINAFLAAMVLTILLSYVKWFGFDLYGTRFHHPLSGVSIFFEHIVQYFFMSIAAFIFGYRFFYRKKFRLMNAIIFILMAVNTLFMSHGRTGYVVFLLLLTYLASIRFGWKGVLSAVLIGMIAFISAYFASPAFRSRLQIIPQQVQSYHKGNTITSIGLRIGMWETATTLIKKHPWIGYGTGGIRTPMQQHLNDKQIKRTALIDYVEYSFLNFILEFGILGFSIFIFAIALQLITSFYLPTEYRVIAQAFLLAYLVGSLANSFFVSFCETHLYSIFSVICFSALKPFSLPWTRKTREVAYESQTYYN
jgi:O-antigen ligase